MLSISSNCQLTKYVLNILKQTIYNFSSLNKSDQLKKCIQIILIKNFYIIMTFIN